MGRRQVVALPTMTISGRSVRRDILLSCFTVESGNLADLTAEKTDVTQVLLKIGMIVRKRKLQQLSCAAGLTWDWLLGLEIDCERYSRKVV
jgi:hypothetical protein